MSEFVVYRRCFWLVLGGFAVSLVWISPTANGEFSARSEFIARLVAPYSVAIESAPFRASLEQVAATTQLNLWVDRTIDPDALVSPGPIEPTVCACLAKIASEQNSVIFPIENFVLVGKPERVDAAAEAILSLQKAAPAPNPASKLVSVHWDMLSTPSEAYSLTTGQGVPVGPPLKLPHDLWHEATWQNVDRDVAASLVLSQVGLRLVRPDAPASTSAATAVTEINSSPPASLTYRYHTESVPPEARKAVQSVDPKARFKDQSGGWDVSTTATGHRLFTHALLQGLAPANQAIAGGPALDTLKNDKRVFTLQLANKPAKDVFAFLAKTANINVEIDVNATAKCDEWVSLEAKDASLLQLIEQVAQRAQVKLQWDQNKLRVTE
jgi:hypothetical protein